MKEQKNIEEINQTQQPPWLVNNLTYVIDIYLFCMMNLNINDNTFYSRNKESVFKMLSAKFCPNEVEKFFRCYLESFEVKVEYIKL